LARFNKKYILVGVAGLALFMGLMLGLSRYYGARAIESSGKILIDAHVGLLEAHYKEFGEYYSSPELFKKDAIAVRPPYFIYFSKDELPQKVLQVLPERDIPALSRKSYCLLMLMENRFDGRGSLWTIRAGGVVEKLAADVPL